MDHPESKTPTRRSLLTMIGTVAGATAMYNAMTEMGLAQEFGLCRSAQAGPGQARRQRSDIGRGPGGDGGGNRAARRWI